MDLIRQFPSFETFHCAPPHPRFSFLAPQKTHCGPRTQKPAGQGSRAYPSENFLGAVLSMACGTKPLLSCLKNPVRSSNGYALVDSCTKNPVA